MNTPLDRYHAAYLEFRRQAAQHLHDIEEAEEQVKLLTLAMDDDASLDAVREKLDKAEDELREWIVSAEHSETLELDGLKVQAVYVEPKWTANTEKLLGMAEFIPKIKEAMTLKPASTQIRKTLT